MNRLIIINSVLVLLLFVYSCSVISGNSDEPELRFEKEYFIVYDEVIHTYRSLDVISIRLKSDIEIDDFNKYIDSMGLQLITPFSYSHYSNVTATHLQGNTPIILLLPSNVNRSQFYSFSDNLKEDSFANNRFIVYSLPAYTRDPEQLTWYYPNNKVSVRPLSEVFSVSELSEQFNLEFQSKNSLIDIFTFTDNQFLNGSPYNLARNIYDSGNYRYVVPDGFWEIVRH